MPFGIGQWELLVLAAVLVLIFGTARLPRIGRDLGRNVREFRRTVEEIDPRQPLKELEAPREPPVTSDATEATRAPDRS
jgi:sec-independent protein translocase protein TatA